MEDLKIFGWEGMYDRDHHFPDGKVAKQTVMEYVFATSYGVVHFKVCMWRSGKTKIFVDTEWGQPLWWNQDDGSRREALKKNLQWGKTRRAVTKAGGMFTPIPFERLGDLEKSRGISNVLAPDHFATMAWRRLTGVEDNQVLGDILDKADDIVAEQRAAYLHEKALVMSEVDNQWGIF